MSGDKEIVINTSGDDDRLVGLVLGQMRGDVIFFNTETPEEPDDKDLMEIDREESQRQMDLEFDNFVNSDRNLPVILSLNIRSMTHSPLLSWDDEIKLFKRLEAGRDARESIIKDDYSDSNLSKLELTMARGLKARDRIILSNTRLVISIAKQHLGRGVDFEDLIQDGICGLMRSIDKYDYTRGFKFSTYATWWIRQTIIRSLADTGSTIRLPVHQRGKYNRLFTLGNQFLITNGRNPTLFELSQLSGISEKLLKKYLQRYPTYNSLNAPVGENEDSEFGELYEGVTDHKDRLELLRKINEILAPLFEKLSFRDRKIIIMRLRLDGGDKLNETKIAERLGLSRSSVGNIYRAFLKELRNNPTIFSQLEDLIE